MPENLVNTAPYEVLAGPLELWLAVTGTAFPDPDEAPGVAWAKVGTNGSRNYDEEGVKVNHGQSLTPWRALGSGGPIKMFRTEESLTIEVTLADLSLEAYKIALNGNSITTTAAGTGTPGEKSIGLSRGLAVTQYALLARGASPYGTGWRRQYEVPVVVQSGEQEVKPTKDTPGLLVLTFTALEDPTASSEAERFGRLVCQNDDAD